MGPSTALCSGFNPGLKPAKQLGIFILGITACPVDPPWAASNRLVGSSYFQSQLTQLTSVPLTVLLVMTLIVEIGFNPS